MALRYTDLNTYLRSIFGQRVHKLTVDAGFTCPNRDGTISTGGCIYCNAAGSGTGAWKKGLSITRQLEQNKLAVARRFKARKFIAYFQAFTNTYAPLEKLKACWDEALAVKDVVGLAIGTRPDCVNRPILDLLENYARTHLVWMEYGLQSAHDRTLKLINRGHDFACFCKAVEATKERGIRICAHVILGLPGEDRSMMLETADALASLGIDGVKLHLLYVVRGTPLARMYRRGLYKCLSRQRYLELVCDFLERLPPEMVIQRLTGDPHRRQLLAPQWALEKQANLEAIRQKLEERNTWQGRLRGAAFPDQVTGRPAGCRNSSPSKSAPWKQL